MTPSAKAGVGSALPQGVGRVLGRVSWRDAQTWAGGVLVAVVVFGAFSSTLGNGFNYDDEVNIVDNPHYRGLGPSHLAWMFTTFHMGHYQPLTWVTLGLDYLIWGRNPFGYHLTNLLLHTANALVVYLLALMLLGVRPASARGSDRRGWGVLLAAVAAALLFAIHPLRVESVAWVTERRDVLSSFFLLLAVLFYLHAHGGAAGTRRGLWVSVALGAFALSLLSRAMGVTLPVILLLLDWHPLHRLASSARRVYIEKIPFLALAVVFAAVAPLAARSVEAAMPLAEHGVVQRVAQACYGLVFYLWKTLLPFGLSPLYELPSPVPVWTAKYLVSAGVVLALLLVLLRCGRRVPGLTTVVLAHVVLLAPVLGFAQVGRQEVADRYSYLPAIGWAILGAGGLLRLWRHAGRRGPAVACTGLAIAGIAGLAGLTWRQGLVWRTPESLWSHAVRCTPSPTTHQNLGAAYAHAGRLSDVIEHYRAAVRLEPLHQPAWYGLAKALSDAGRLDEAAGAWEEVLRHAPNDARANVEYAKVLHARGRADDALRACATAVRLDPQSVEARVDLAALLIESRRLDEALAELHQALAIDPRHPDAHYNLANALAQRGDVEGAIGEYRAALAARPDFAEAGINLGAALDRAGQTDAAVQAYRDVVRRHPAQVIARYNLALALSKLGRRDEAIAELREVLRRQPEHAEARRVLDTLAASVPRD